MIAQFFRRVVGAGMFASATLMALPVHADAGSAAQNFFQNLASIGGTLPVTQQTALVEPVRLVNGMYSLKSKGGEFIGYINEAGTMFGDSRAMQVLIPRQGIRPLNAQEARAAAQEFVSAINFDALVPVRYGRGSDRKIVLFSAVDCPYCGRLEKGLQGLEKQGKLDATLYVVPSSLQPIAQGALPQWQKVASIWCSANSGDAWKGYWAGVKNAGAIQPGCGVEQVVANRRQLMDLLMSVGIKINGVPALLNEEAQLQKVPNLDLQDASSISGARRQRS